MKQHKIFVVTVVIFILSQWSGMIWLSDKISFRQATDQDVQIESALAGFEAQLKRIEALQYTKLATVNPEANTVTMDQSMLQNTLRDIVSEELERISPSLKREYTNTATATAYASQTPNTDPVQAYVQSQAIMQEAIQYGEWSARHTAEMAPFVNSLTQEQRLELTEQYMDALSRGEIKPTDIPPPL